MRLGLVVLPVLLLGCATETALLKQTPSGYPEELLTGVTVESTRAAIMDVCAARGSLVQESAGNHVVCGKVMTGGDAVLAQLLIGNSYSTQPELKVRFTIYQSSAGVRVTAQQWMETQMAFGQMRRQDLNGNAQRNQIQAVLSALPGSPTNQLGAVAAQRAAALPSPAPSLPPGSEGGAMPPAPPAGKDIVVAERMARELGCATRDTVGKLLGKGPGQETYSFQCANGETLVLRCEFGNCRPLR
jgi:hypothetical protein